MSLYLNWLARFELTKAIIGRNVPDVVADQIIHDFEVRMSRFKNETEAGMGGTPKRLNQLLACKDIVVGKLGMKNIENERS